MGLLVCNNFNCLPFHCIVVSLTLAEFVALPSTPVAMVSTEIDPEESDSLLRQSPSEETAAALLAASI
jgi:hypothetical protein